MTVPSAARLPEDPIWPKPGSGRQTPAQVRSVQPQLLLKPRPQAAARWSAHRPRATGQGGLLSCHGVKEPGLQTQEPPEALRAQRDPSDLPVPAPRTRPLSAGLTRVGPPPLRRASRLGACTRAVGDPLLLGGGWAGGGQQAWLPMCFLRAAEPPAEPCPAPHLPGAAFSLSI